MALDCINKFLKWGYGSNNGPHVWPEMFPIAKSGCRQSPIDVEENEAEADAFLKPVQCSFGPGQNYRLENTGNSWQLHLWPNETSLMGGPLLNQYKAFQIHAHWGSEPGKGSEHTINGKNFDAEIHIVHYNTKYSCAGEALDQPDGLAVLGVLVNTGEPHPHFDIIARKLEQVQRPSEETVLDTSFDPELLLPQDRSYFTYPGSLTTPPLYESVTWILFNSPIQLSNQQINQMRSLMGSKKKSSCIVNNYRFTNDKKGRTVKKFSS